MPNERSTRWYSSSSIYLLSVLLLYYQLRCFRNQPFLGQSRLLSFLLSFSLSPIVKVLLSWWKYASLFHSTSASVCLSFTLSFFLTVFLCFFVSVFLPFFHLYYKTVLFRTNRSLMAVRQCDWTGGVDYNTRTGAMLDCVVDSKRIYEWFWHLWKFIALQLPLSPQVVLNRRLASTCRCLYVIHEARKECLTTW